MPRRILHRSGWLHSVGVLLLITSGCGGEDGARVYQRPEPPTDGTRVIRYVVDVLEDDTDCGARVPYKESTEELVVEWHTDQDITIYARGGLYVTDVTLDENGEYERDGRGGPCLEGSSVWGRLTRSEGESRTVCIKRECDVVITGKARRK